MWKSGFGQFDHWKVLCWSLQFSSDLLLEAKSEILVIRHCKSELHSFIHLEEPHPCSASSFIVYQQIPSVETKLFISVFILTNICYYFLSWGFSTLSKLLLLSWPLHIMKEICLKILFAYRQKLHFLVWLGGWIWILSLGMRCTSQREIRKINKRIFYSPTWQTWTIESFLSQCIAYAC